MLLTCGAFALFLAFADHAGRGKLPPQRRPRRLGTRRSPRWPSDFLIGAVQYLPVLEYVPFSPRAGGKGWEHAVSYSHADRGAAQHVSAAVQRHPRALLGPQRHPLPQRVPRRGRAACSRSAAFGGAERGRRSAASGSASLVVSVLWSLGGYTPFYHIVYALVPGTKFFRAPSTMLMVVAMATAVLAALGTERAFSRRPLAPVPHRLDRRRPRVIALLASSARSRRSRTRSWPRASRSIGTEMIDAQPAAPSRSAACAASSSSARPRRSSVLASLGADRGARAGLGARRGRRARPLVGRARVLEFSPRRACSTPAIRRSTT